MLPSSDDLKLLDILMEQHNLTPTQKARLEKALQSGKDLMAAVMSTPIIDPLDLIKARDHLRRSSSGLVPKLTGAQTPAPGTNQTHHSTTSSDSLSRDDDGVQVVDWEGMDFRLTPVPTDEETESRSARVTLKTGTLATDRILRKDRLESSGDAGLLHDMSVDEGFGLVRHVNRLLGNAIENDRKAVQIAWTDTDAMIADYDTQGMRISERQEDPVLADKMAAHFKVLARITPWKEEAQTGAFTAERSGRRHRITVSAEMESHQRKLTVIIAS